MLQRSEFQASTGYEKGKCDEFQPARLERGRTTMRKGTAERKVTSSRTGRLVQLGRLAGGIAGNLLSEGANRLARGERPSLGSLLLTPANAGVLAERLSEMRGAAMKVGQLISMDSGQVLPAQFGEALAQLREQAHYMPLGQVAAVLKAAWGDNWHEGFARFSFTPCAAASIGQVHDASLRDGRRLAVKVQYPGIARSIDSDVNNVAALLKLFRMVPEGMDLQPLLDEAKRQLHVEADYLHEADALRDFRNRLSNDPRFTVPQLVDRLTTSQVIAMEYLEGVPIERLSERTGEEKNAAAAALLELALRELFEWGRVQTDPNFANYLYQPQTRQIQLLDFGAVRGYGPERRETLLKLLNACIGGNDRDLAAAAAQVGYLGDNDPAAYVAAVVKLLRAATEPLRWNGSYDFGKSDLAARMSELLIDIRLNNRFTRMPPAEILFLHRKLGGLYLLLVRLKAEIAVGELIARLQTAGQSLKTVPI